MRRTLAEFCVVCAITPFLSTVAIAEVGDLKQVNNSTDDQAPDNDTYLEGKCAFGDTVRKVRCTRGSGTRGKKAAKRKRDNDALFNKVQIADEKGVFLDYPTGGSPLGHPVSVANKWYKLSISEMKITATEMICDTGKISLKSEKWRLTLKGRKLTYTVEGGTDPVDVPVGTYQMCQCEHVSKDGQIQVVVNNGWGEPLQVTAGQTVSTSIDLPVKLDMAWGPRSKGIIFSVFQTDSTGKAFLSFLDASGRKPAPCIEVIDKTGKIIHSASMTYG